MKSKLTVALLLALGLAVLCGPLSAHHGNVAYDMNHPITVKGTVTEFVWANPHVQVYFDVKDSTGKIVHWSCETSSPGKLSRSGWNKTTLKPGDQVTIKLRPAKSGSPVGFMQEVILPDGKKLGLEEAPDY